MKRNYNRREWLQTSALGLALLQFGFACRFLPQAKEKQGPFYDIWIFGAMPDPTDPVKKSILYWADFTQNKLSQFSVPVRDAHKVVTHAQDPAIIYILGVESNSVCRFNLRTRSVEKNLALEEQYVTSGHAVYAPFRGKEALFVTEYRLDSPSQGSVSVRDLDFSLLHRFSSGGAYPHVIVANPKQGELVVQNLGHKAGDEAYSSTAILQIFDGKNLKTKRQYKPGREGKRYTFSEERSEGTEEARRFRKLAAYQLDSRRIFYPETSLLVNEHPSFHSFSEWNMSGGKMLREVRLGNIVPTHLMAVPFLPFYVINDRDSGLHFVAKHGHQITANPAFQGFRTSMHLTMCPATA